MARSKWKRGRTAPTLCADVRRFSQLNNADWVFGTHRVQKVLDARQRIFQQPPWSQLHRERSSCANFFTAERFRLVLFLSEYYSLTSPTQRRHRALWQIQSWT